MPKIRRTAPFFPAPEKAGAPVAWPQDGRVRTGTVWGPGDLKRSLWAVPDAPDGDEVAVLLRRAELRKDDPDADRPLLPVQTETRRTLATRLRRTNALAAPGARVVLSAQEETVPDGRARNHLSGASTVVRAHVTVHVASCPALPGLAEEVTRTRAAYDDAVTARFNARAKAKGFPAQQAAWAGHTAAMPGRQSVSEPRGTYEHMLLSRDGKPAGTVDGQTVTGWCQYCLDAPGLLDGARAVLPQAVSV